MFTVNASHRFPGRSFWQRAFALVLCNILALIALPCSSIAAQSALTALVADFTYSLASEDLPLTVVFADASAGSITSWSWDFGDGSTSTEHNPTHNYAVPGTYRARLLVIGPRGTDTIYHDVTVTASSSTGVSAMTEIYALAGVLQRLGVKLAQESDEVTVGADWMRVEFSRPFMDPVVAVMTASDSNPVLIGVRNVDQHSFEIRTAECSAPDAALTGAVSYPVAVSYFVLEGGSYTLEDGTPITARQRFLWDGCAATLAQS